MRKCEVCQKEKTDFCFDKQGSTFCKWCKNQKHFKKYSKVLERNLTIIDLEKNLPSYQAFSFRYNRQIHYQRTVKLVETEVAVVYASDSIAMIQDMRHDLLRFDVMERDRYNCHYCNNEGLTVDHIIPVIYGGKWSLDNLVCSCTLCNSLKGSTPYEIFIKHRAEIIDRRQKLLEVEDNDLESKLQKLLKKFR